MNASSAEVLHCVRLPRHLVDVERHELRTHDGQHVELRPQALDLLIVLARHAGHVVTKTELLKQVWPGVLVTDDSLVQAVGDARQAIGDDAHQVIQTAPRRGYRLIASSAPAADTPLAAAEAPAAAPVPRNAPAPDRPPIAVLDFRDAAASAEEQMVARGFAEDLVHELSRNADLRVIAAHSSFAAASGAPSWSAAAQRLGARYVVNGTVQRVAEVLRLTVQLLDSHDSRVVWSERHQVGAQEVLAARDAIVERIAAALHSTMRRNEEARMLQRAPASLDIYEMTLRAIALKHRFIPDDMREAKALLERVVELDPRYAPGWLYLGMVSGLSTLFQFNGPFSLQRLNDAIVQLEHSITLNAELPAAYQGLSIFYPAAGRHADGVRAGRRGLELGPSDPESMMFLAVALVFAGQPAEALPLAQRALERNPLPPNHVLYFHGLTMWANGDVDAARLSLDDALRRAPTDTASR